MEIENFKIIDMTPNVVESKQMLKRYKIMFDISTKDYIASAIRRTLADEIFDMKTLNVNLTDIKSDDIKVNIDEIKMIISQLKIKQNIPSDAEFKLEYSYNSTMSNDTSIIKTIYTDSIKCVNYPEINIPYKAPLFDISIGKYLKVYNITVKTNKTIRDIHLVYLGAIEYETIGEDDLNNRPNKFHFGINGYDIISEKQLIEQTFNNITKRLEYYLNSEIKMTKFSENQVHIHFTEETLTIPYLLEGYYFDKYNPNYISAQEFEYELKKFNIIIDDEDIEERIRTCYKELIQIFIEIKEKIIDKIPKK
jgi:hypothetical protein